MCDGRTSRRGRGSGVRPRRVRNLGGRRTVRDSGAIVAALRTLRAAHAREKSRGTRRYSADDLARLRRISGLVEAGVNLAGIARILELEDDNETLAAANTDLRSTNRTLREAAKAAKPAESRDREGTRR